jgi:Leucine-rich repeat (LRR) protein
MSMAEALRRIEKARETSATELYLSRLGLTEWPQEITLLKHLQKLHLRRNQITEVPHGIGELAELRELSLAGNPVGRLPEEFWNLTKLSSLWLDATELAMLPPNIGVMRKLTKLALWGNKLKTLPREIGDLTTLRELYLGENQLSFYLHSLGIALNYKDDARLQDMHVLNPRWITNGIYRIINSKYVLALPVPRMGGDNFSPLSALTSLIFIVTTPLNRKQWYRFLATRMCSCRITSC